MKLSAKLKEGKKGRLIKSRTHPRTILSKKFDKAPARIKTGKKNCQLKLSFWRISLKV